MWRLVVLGGVVLALAGCESSQQRAGREAREDNALCATYGLKVGDPQYYNCREQAADQRFNRELMSAMRAQAFSSNAAVLAGIYAAPAPAVVRAPLTCQPYGASVQCW